MDISNYGLHIMDENILWIINVYSVAQHVYKTRNLRYRKDDCAMRPIYGCPGNFRESLSTPTATFAEIFNGLLFQSIL